MRFPVFIALGLCLAGEAFAIPPDASDGRARGRASERRYISAHAYYHAMRADLARSSGDLEVARQSLRLALVYDPASVDLHLQLARVLVDLGEGEPERLVQRAIQLAPSRAAGWAAKGDLLVRRGRRRGAERAYLRAVRIEPASPEGRHAAAALAASYQRNGRPELARRTLKRLAELGAPEDALLLATHDLEEGRLEDAERGLLALAPRGGPELQRQVAERLAWLLRFDLAHDLYARSLQGEDERRRVTDHELRFALHLALLADDRASALRLLERLASRAAPTEQRRAAESVLTAGRASWLRDHLSGRSAEPESERDLFILALEAAAGGSEASLRLRAADPTTPSARVLLAEALLRRGEVESAKQALEVMTLAEPQHLEATLGLEMYERLASLLLRLSPEGAARLLEGHPSPSRAAILAARSALANDETLLAYELLASQRLEADRDALVLLSLLELPPERQRRVELRVRQELERDPHHAGLWQARARLYLQRDDRARARVALGRALVLDPGVRGDEVLLRELSLGEARSPRTFRRGARP